MLPVVQINKALVARASLFPSRPRLIASCMKPSPIRFKGITYVPRRTSCHLNYTSHARSQGTKQQTPLIQSRLPWLGGKLYFGFSHTVCGGNFPETRVNAVTHFIIRLPLFEARVLDSHHERQMASSLSRGSASGVVRYDKVGAEQSNARLSFEKSCERIVHQRDAGPFGWLSLLRSRFHS